MIVFNLFYDVSISEDYLMSNNWLIVNKDLRVKGTLKKEAVSCKVGGINPAPT
jgi:hypothetical protein